MARKITLIIFTIVIAIALAELVAFRHSKNNPIVSAPVLNDTAALPVVPSQPNVFQNNGPSEAIFVGSVITNYQGRRFEMRPDGTLAPIAD
jgi:hypothetical protein